MLQKVILASASVDKIVKCAHSIESNGAVLSLACVASVSVWFRSKERTVLDAREMKREPKNDRGGEVSFLSSPPPPHSFTRTSFDYCSRSLLLNRRKRLLRRLYFLVVLFITCMLYKVVRSNFWLCGWNSKVSPFKWKLRSSTFLWWCLSCCTRWFVLTFWVWEWNSKVWPFNWKLRSSTFLWYCLLHYTRWF